MPPQSLRMISTSGMTAAAWTGCWNRARTYVEIPVKTEALDGLQAARRGGRL